MTKKKKDLPIMPEHTKGDNCPACAEVERVMNELNASAATTRLKNLTEMIRVEHEAIEREFGVRITTVYIGALENEQTDRIGIYPKTVLVQSKDKSTAEELVNQLGQMIVMPAIADKLGDIFASLKETRNKMEGVPNTRAPFFGGPKGEA